MTDGGGFHGETEMRTEVESWHEEGGDQMAPGVSVDGLEVGGSGHGSEERTVRVLSFSTMSSSMLVPIYSICLSIQILLTSKYFNPLKCQRVTFCPYVGLLSKCCLLFAAAS